MIPHPDDMRAIAESIEQDFEDRMGWDATPMLGMVLRQPQEVVDRNARPEFASGRFVVYGVFPFPVQPTEIDDNPGQGLLTLGTMLRHSPNAPEVIIPRTIVQDFAGLLFVGEGYGMAYDTQQERDAETRRFADIPGAKEVRFGVLLDSGGRVHFADRVRGEKPTVRTAEPDDPRVRSSVNVIIGLRDIMVAIGARVPFGTMDLDAVASVAREDEP